MRYEFYHEKDLEDVLESVKDFAKLVFKRFKNTEIYSEGVVVGKYNDIVFVASEKPIRMGVKPLGSLDVEFGKEFKLTDGKLIVDRWDEETLYDYIPSVFSEYFKLMAILSEMESYSNIIHNYERIVSEELKTLIKIERTEEIETFENLIENVYQRHTEFLNWISSFKRLETEFFKSFIAFKSLAGDKLSDIIRDFELRYDYYKTLREGFERTLDRLNELFQMLSLKLDTMRNKEYLEMQRKTSALQVAAGIIEFVAVFYYTLKSWEYFVDLEDVPKHLSFTLLMIFTTSVVWLTDVLGESIAKKKILRRILIPAVIMAITLTLMIYIIPFSRFLGL